MDCVLGYHTNPLTCGVGRFNRALADQLGLRVYQIFSEQSLAAMSPLLSFKASEISQVDLKRLAGVAANSRIWPELRLFFHDYSATAVEAKLISRAVKVYSGNEVLTAQLRAVHSDVVQAWCPGYLFERRYFDFDAEIKIYTFGMAHKLRADYYARLHKLLERTGKSYLVYVSAAIHEGTSLDDSFTSAYEELQAIFGDKVFFLGFVSDAALHAFLKTCHFFAAFFREGVRANNTSVNTALQSGVVVLTNLDESSPSEFRHLENIVDIQQCEHQLPLDVAVLERVAANGLALAQKFGWPPLLELFRRGESTSLTAPPVREMLRARFD